METTTRPVPATGRRAVRIAALVAVPLVLAGGAIVHRNWTAARKHQDECSAIQDLKKIQVAQTLFREGDRDENGVLDYADSLEALGHAGLLDPELASGTRNGYAFVTFRSDAVVNSTSMSEFLWGAEARPVEPGVTGDRMFNTNQGGSIAFQLFDPECGKPTHQHRSLGFGSGGKVCFGPAETAPTAERRRDCSTIGAVTSR